MRGLQHPPVTSSSCVMCHKRAYSWEEALQDRLHHEELGEKDRPADDYLEKLLPISSLVCRSHRNCPDAVLFSFFF